MASDRIQKIVERFIAEIVEVAEEEAMERIQARLGEAFGGGAKVPKVNRKKASKRKRSMLRPCPIEGCQSTAAPIYQMVCKEHSQTCSREEILIARDRADRPGGVWYGTEYGKTPRADKKTA